MPGKDPRGATPAPTWPTTCGGSKPASRSGAARRRSRAALALVPPQAGRRGAGRGALAGFVGVATQWWRAEVNLAEAMHRAAWPRTRLQANRGQP